MFGLKTLNDLVIDPVVAGMIEAQGGAAFAGIKQEAVARVMARFGEPGNHDIERAVRVAQIQSLMLVVKHYGRLVDTMRGLDDPVDPITRRRRSSQRRGRTSKECSRGACR